MLKLRRHAILIVLAAAFCGPAALAEQSVAPFLLEGNWQLVFVDAFDEGDEALDATWGFQNGPSSRILCSRWRENADVMDGILSLNAKKETRGGQDWTAASMWTKSKFKYGYFECRYRYAKSEGTNNSFWIMTRDMAEDAPGRFAIDINEGHYPDEINMNFHRWKGELLASHKIRTVEGANLAEEFHVYGLEWNEKEMIWYFDGEEIRRERNAYCHEEASVLLSLAIFNWAGPVTDSIDGTSMEVDYVKVYQKKSAE